MNTGMSVMEENKSYTANTYFKFQLPQDIAFLPMHELPLDCISVILEMGKLAPKICEDAWSSIYLYRTFC